MQNKKSNKTNKVDGKRRRPLMMAYGVAFFIFILFVSVKRRLLDCFMLSQFALNTLFIEWMK